MATEMSLRVGGRIRARRIELGLKQRELADRMPAAVDNQRISDWERGVNQPSPRYLELLATALDVDASYFMGANGLPAETPDPFDQDDLIGRLDRIDQRLDIGEMERQAMQRLIEGQNRLLQDQTKLITELRDLVATQQSAARRLEQVAESAAAALPRRGRRQGPADTSKDS